MIEPSQLSKCPQFGNGPVKTRSIDSFLSKYVIVPSQGRLICPLRTVTVAQVMMMERFGVVWSLRFYSRIRML